MKDDLVGVPAGTQLLRRINPRFCDWNELDEFSRPRITRQAVQFYRQADAQRLGFMIGAMSFHMESLSPPIEELHDRFPESGFARIGVDDVRVGGHLGAQHHPSEDDPGHVIVFHADGRQRLAGRQAQRLAEILSLRWEIVPPRPER